MTVFLLSIVAAALFTFVVRVNGHGSLAPGYCPGNLSKSPVTHGCTRAAAPWRSAARQRLLESWDWNLHAVKCAYSTLAKKFHPDKHTRAYTVIAPVIVRTNL